MNKNVTDYLNLACGQIKSKQQRLSARAELMSHIQASVSELGRVPTTPMARFLVNFSPLFVSFSLRASSTPRQNFLDWQKIAAKIVPFP